MDCAHWRFLVYHFDSGWFDSWFRWFGRPENVYAQHLPLAIAGVFLACATLRRLKLYRRLSAAPSRRKSRAPARAACHDRDARHPRRRQELLQRVGGACSFLLLLACCRAAAIVFRLEFRAASQPSPPAACSSSGPRHGRAPHAVLPARHARQRQRHLSASDERMPPRRGERAGRRRRLRPDLAETPDVVQVIVAAGSRAASRNSRRAEAAADPLQPVPDMFLMTSSVSRDGGRHSLLSAQSARQARNRVVKRKEQSARGRRPVLAPVIALMALLIKRESRAVFYSQTRRLRRQVLPDPRSLDARRRARDRRRSPRRTIRAARGSAWMRAHNVDELPAVLERSGRHEPVGPRPERLSSSGSSPPTSPTTCAATSPARDHRLGAGSRCAAAPDQEPAPRPLVPREFLALTSRFCSGRFAMHNAY